MAKEKGVVETSENDEIVKLIDLGGKVEDAIYGFAFAGNVRQVKRLLEGCPEAQKTFYIGYAIKGYARAGNFDAIYEIPNYQDSMKDMVIGLAQAGNKEKLQPILDKNIKLFAQTVEGYAEGNHQSLLIKLIKGTSFYPKAIFYAARSGHTTLVNALLKDCGVSVDFKVESLNGDGSSTLKSQSQINAYSLLNYAVKGYASGGHFKEVAALLERGASISQCIFSIQDGNGLYHLDPFYVLLSYVKNEDIASKVLDQIKIRFSISEKDILSQDMARFQKIKNLMGGGVNYLDAAKKADIEIKKGIVDDEEQALKYSLDPTGSIDVTLHTLAQTLCEEMDLKGMKVSSNVETRKVEL